MKFPFRGEVPEETISKIMLFITIFQALTALIGGLCILVGGIGIMNIMLVTIAERIKEIGLRKALGATGGDIVRQFLIECMLLCLISGVVGTVVGAVFCNLVAWIGHTALPDTIPSQLLLNPTGLLFGLGTALVCGMTFGMMPALRASHLDPSEALRSE
jgi:ABC-type antimicrobial peptide transport system permease subunit